MLTGLRDTPIITSGVFDDFGRPKFDPDEFRRFNADSVLLLDQGRARRWTAGGDRPAPRDLHNYTSGATASFRFILSQVGAVPSEALVWRLVADDGHEVASGSLPLRAWPAPGQPTEVASLDLALPAVTTPKALTLEASISGVANSWPLWVYPDVQLALPGVFAHDPAGQFGERWPAWLAGHSSPALLMAGVFDDDVAAFVRAGGRAVLLQPGPGRLPAQPLTFWRETLNRIYDHPLLRQFPHTGHTDLQFYHLAADHALQTAALADWSPVPVIQRLDARLFTVTDYLTELRPGAGRMLASTLRFFGGAGDQSHFLDDKPSARFLLREMMAYLQDERPPG